jgi:heme-degrading monooxygenase HmoA
MFMRFLQLKIKQDSVKSFIDFYESDVIDKLHNTPGCLFAGLIKSKPEENEFISLTFWETQTQAENYENTGAFKKLFEQGRVYMSESAEWNLRLSEDMELKYGPVDEEPVIKKYVVAAQNTEGVDFKIQSSNMYLRILSMVIQEDRLNEFKKLYSEVIIPSLKSINGCRYIYLTESISEKNEFISVTVWDSKEDADEYERSGKFQELTNKIKHTFSQLFLWKMSLEKDYNARVKTSEDLKVELYNIVTGKSFL